MANPIQRIVRLVLDRRAAQKTEADAKKSLKGIERGLSSLKSLALKVGAAIGVAFGTRVIFRFLKDSTKVGAEAQAIWNRLSQAVENTGTSYQAVEQDIHRVANAMQDATRIGDEEFATILTELLTTSGDYAASLREVGTVVDLATAKQIDMKSAAMLVGRAMVGQTQTLTRYGIVVKEGEDAMEVLRRTFRGFAANEANTAEGKLAQLNNAWDDFKQAIGEAIIAGADGESMLERLTAAVKELTREVDLFARRYANVNETFFQDQKSIDRIVAASKTPEDALRRLEVFRRETEKQLDAARETAENAPNAWLALVKATVVPGGPEPLSVFSRIRTESALTEEEVQGLQQTLDFLTKTMTDIQSGARSIGTALPGATPPARRGPPAIQSRTPTLRIAPPELPKPQIQEILPFNAALTDLNDTLATSRTMSALLGDQWDATATEINAITTAMQALADQGVGPLDSRMQALVGRFQEIQEESRLAAKQQKLMADVGQASAEILNAAFGAGIGQLAAAKAKQNAILALEQTAQGFVATLNPFTAPLAAGHYAAAAQFAGIAAAWGALAAVTGGFGGGGGGGGGGRTGGGGRDVGGRASQGLSSPGPEVAVYFTGEGFDAVNPRVQRVVYTALRAAQQSAGENARVRVFRGKIPTQGR